MQFASDLDLAVRRPLTVSFPKIAGRGLSAARACEIVDQCQGSEFGVGTSDRDTRETMHVHAGAAPQCSQRLAGITVGQVRVPSASAAPRWSDPSARH